MKKSKDNELQYYELNAANSRLISSSISIQHERGEYLAFPEYEAMRANTNSNPKIDFNLIFFMDKERPFLAADLYEKYNFKLWYNNYEFYFAGDISSIQKEDLRNGFITIEINYSCILLKKKNMADFEGVKLWIGLKSKTPKWMHKRLNTTNYDEILEEIHINIGDGVDILL